MSGGDIIRLSTNCENPLIKKPLNMRINGESCLKAIIPMQTEERDIVFMAISFCLMCIS